jgi:hypothetical protein
MFRKTKNSMDLLHFKTSNPRIFKFSCSLAGLNKKQHMKRLTLIAFLIAAGTASALAQSKTLVGKWKLSSISTEGITVNVDNPAETKKLLAEQMKKAGQPSDSAQIEMMYNMVAPMFSSMTIEFTDKGKAFFYVPGPSGATSDTASYVADYTKGTFVTTSKTESGTEKKETSKFSFEGALLVVENEEKGELIKLKRAD